MKKYEISFNNKRYKSKPSGAEIGKISNRLYTKSIDFRELAHKVGACGCTFSPAVYDGKRRKENFIGHQLIGLDFDNGVTFAEIKSRAEHYRLPILFAYKTFSCTKEYEKFRVAFALSDMIISFVTYMNDKYGASHYTREIKKFYQNIGIKYDKILPVFDNGKFIYEEKSSSVSENSADKNKGRRAGTRNFDWNILHKKCRLYRDFAEGNEYFYYPQLFHIAINLVNIKKGKNEFLRILKSPKNADYETYHKRNWEVILTAKPGKSTILQITEKEYVTIEEAEDDLKNNFLQAVDSEKQGVHIIKAQTGIGKTNFYLLYTEKTFLIAVPTHKLKMEVYNKAVFKGVKSIAFTPEMPDFSDEIQEKINHIYSVGAGKYVHEMMLEMCEKIPKDSPDYTALSSYLSALESIMDFDGHIITTHDRLLLQGKKSKLLEHREVIIDEDIMRTMLSTYSIDNSDILWAVNSNLFSNQVVEKMKSIVKNTGYQRYNYQDNETVELTDEIVAELENADGNIIDLADSCYVYNDGKTTSFLKRKWLTCKKVIVMSATANAEIYSMLTHYDVHYYPCKMAEYMGKLKLYPKYTFSRHSLTEQERIIDYLKNKIGDDTVITFKAFEKLFDTEYHYGAVEGLNCIEGKNISVIGLPNVDELVYKLYGMATCVNVDNFNMRSFMISALILLITKN